MNLVEKFAFLEFLVGHDLLVQRDRRLDTFDDHHVERTLHSGDREFPCAGVNDELCDHRIVVRRHDVARINRSIDADAGTAGNIERRDLARARRKLYWVLGVDAALDRVADDLDVDPADIAKIVTRVAMRI